MPVSTLGTESSSRFALVQLPEAEGLDSLVSAVRRGLRARPRTLPCAFFYDEVGSRLFEQICDLPEYYLTRTEDSILRTHAPAMIAGWDRAPLMIELGSGSSSKTRRLIAAGLTAYGSLHYVPIDISPTILEESASALVDIFGRLEVTAYAGDYSVALETLAGVRGQRPKLFVFLGSSLGNYAEDEAVELLGRIARAMGPGDRLLLGTDLVKDPAILEAAYDDAKGVTAAFNLNLLQRINRELLANFQLDQFAHRSIFKTEQSRIEMHLVSQVDQEIHIPGADLTVRLIAGETIQTENCHKYTPEILDALAQRAGFVEDAYWTDPAGLFRVQRWRLRRGVA